jgi:hypothetical protein
MTRQIVGVSFSSSGRPAATIAATFVLIAAIDRNRCPDFRDVPPTFHLARRGDIGGCLRRHRLEPVARFNMCRLGID